MRDTSLYKSVVIILLLITSVLQVLHNELDYSVMKYIWPIQLLIIILFFIMISGMEKDRKEINSLVGAWIGKDGKYVSIKVDLISFIVFLPYFLLTLLPMILLKYIGIFATPDVKGESEVMSLFIEGWLVFSSTIFFNVFIINTIYKSLVIPWLTRNSIRSPSSAA
jgi:hypothetical protein